jgi:DNA (cytosine-5)-methyltransferase 1
VEGGLILDARAATNPEYVELESGLVIPEWLAEERAQEERLPRAVDLFCGCGGMSLGMMQEGWHVVAAVDNAPEAAITYMHNLGSYPAQFHFIEEADGERLEKHLQKSMLSKKGGITEGFISGANRHHLVDVPGVPNFFFGDITKLTGAAILKAIGMERGELDCVCGSPPCQGFSRAGKRQVADPRNNLVFEFARIVVELLPKTMVFENVPGIVDMVTPDGVPVMDHLVMILEDGSFATADSFQRTLRARTGSVGVLRGKPPKKAAGKTAKKKAPRSAQRRLFA